MKTVCIYHSVDLDGYMSAAIVKHWWQKEQGSYIQENNHITNPNTGENSIDFIGYNYGQPIPNLLEYDRVIMCDVSFPKEDMERLYSQFTTNFIWIDHHISAINDNIPNVHVVNGKDTSKFIYTGLIDTKFAACEITWMYFFPNEPMPEIVRLLGRYDCFGHKGTGEETKVLEFQYGARAFIENYEDAYSMLEEEITERISSIVDRLHLQGLSIYKYLCTEAKQSYKNGFEIDFRNDIIRGNITENGILKFICINKERFNPINFGINYHKEGYDGAACFHYANGKWNFSLYNDNGEVDCSKIAKQFGGGGHKGAAGFRIKNINDIIKNE